jgi:hypothetical protein
MSLKYIYLLHVSTSLGHLQITLFFEGRCIFKKIYNGIRKSASDNVCSATDSLKKRMLPEDGPMKLKHVVNVYILMTCETF